MIALIDNGGQFEALALQLRGRRIDHRANARLHFHWNQYHPCLLLQKAEP